MPAALSPFVQPLMIPTLLLKCLLDLGKRPSQPKLFPIFTVTNGFRWWGGRGAFEQTLDGREQNICKDFGLLALLAETGCREHGTGHEIGGNWWEVVGRVQSHEGDRRCERVFEM